MFRAQIATHWDDLRTLSDADLDARLAARPVRAENILTTPAGAESFALPLEVLRRQEGFGLRDNQIACALALLRGECVELRTGEGKTLAAVLAALVAARSGVSVHVITVNDYLAKRDHDLMAPAAKRMGLVSDVLTQETQDPEKRIAYDVDILYGTNKVFVFDHLRDRREARQSSANVARQMGQALAIVDEADSVLIDDATVPMILSEQGEGVAPHDEKLFRVLVDFARALAVGTQREKDKNGSWRLTLEGLSRLENLAQTLEHPVARTEDILGLVDQALAACYGLRAGESYVIQDGKIVLIDQSTGRMMPDRRWAYGLHQMAEISAGLDPTPENRTVAQITQQTYFRQYRILSGLTGTARECRGELWAIYRLMVTSIAPNRPPQLKDLGFRTYASANQKWAFIHDRAREVAQDRAVLIGVNDVVEAETLAKLFAQSGREVSVLDALSEAQEADLVAVAGQAGRITIATHLAGRGTDIGLSAEVRDAGGLHVIIASAMASGRLERQLYGRSGRQGDPGSYERVISTEDRGLIDGAFSIWRTTLTGALRLGLAPAWALSRIQANRDARALAMRRQTLLREQELARQLGYG